MIKCKDMDIKNLRKWVPALIVMLLIFILSSTPGKTLNYYGLGAESLHISGHSIMFFLLCFAFYKAQKDITISILLTTIYGVLDEFHQMFTPNRSSSFFDIATDFVGALVAGFIIWKLQYILPKKLKNWLNN